MSRIPLDVAVRTKLGPTRSGVRIYIYQRGTKTEVTGYTTETGSTKVTYPLITDLEGRCPNAWYPPGSYDMYSPDDALNPTQPWEATLGGAIAGAEQPFINVKDSAYGAKGDDVTDDTSAFQAAHDALPATGGVIVVPGGLTYHLAGVINITKPVIWFLYGARIRRSAEARMFDTEGSVGADVNLTADVAVGDTVLKFNTAGIADGDYLNLRSNLATGAPSGSTEGEIVQVHTVTSGAELKLRAPVAGAYAKADTARIAKLFLLSGCKTYGGEFTQDGPLTKDIAQGFLNFRYTIGATMVEPIFEHMEEFAAQFDASLDWKVVRPIVRDMLFDEAEEQYAYGILARGPSQGGEVIDGTGESAQIFNTGGTTRGYPRHCKATGKASGKRATPTAVAKSPFSLHSDCAFITLDIEIDGWDDLGLQIKGTDHDITVKARRCLGIGVAFIADSKTIYPERVKLEVKVEDVAEFEGNIGIGVDVKGVDHEIDVWTADTDGYGVNVNRSANEEPCSGSVIRVHKIRNYSRGNPSVYNAVRLGPVGITDIEVVDPYACDAPDGARAYRFEGGEAGNPGCKLVRPRIGPGVETMLGDTERFALEGKGYVNHGEDGEVARNESVASVEWNGAAEPSNALPGDDWFSVIGLEYEAKVKADTPISYWRLGEMSGTVAADAVGANPGAYKAAPVLGALGAIKGDPNTAVSLTATSKQYVAVPDSASLDFGDVFSYEAWVQRDNIGSNHVILDKGSGSALLRYTTADKLLFRRNGVANICESTITIKDLNWHHVVVTKNGATVKMYIDGKDVTGAVTNSALANTAIALGIGAADAGTGEYFNGDIDEVAVYGTALSAARVLVHYEAGLGKFVPQLKVEDAWVLGSSGARTEGMGVIVHGSTAGTARGTAFAQYMWIGSVAPINIAQNDIWIDTTDNSIWIEA